ncbi:MAG: helix-turn-helix transcriptional regulator [Kiritimatiellia bacterium]|nr:helix-turn-helix transcriptional regulator [Kiritimatiellia bacterium]
MKNKVKVKNTPSGSLNMPDFDRLRFYRETFKTQLGRLRHGRFTLHLPRPLGEMRRIAGTHFHFDPELFIQARGLTDFSFPKEKMRLRAGEALLVPRGLPHAEIARKSRSDFLNVVVMFPREGVSIHTGVEGDRRKPVMKNLEYFKTDKGHQIEQYLDDITDFYHSAGNLKKDPEVKEAIQGLFRAALAGLLLIVKQVKTPERAPEHPKVSECRKFILSHIYETSLSVKKLADQIHCSPDYLSHLFVTETGEHLTDFIHQERIALAKRHLRNPVLSIKEIAWSCGFTDQGYFTRLFKQLSGETPKAFREKFRTAIFAGQRRPPPFS